MNKELIRQTMAHCNAQLLQATLQLSVLDPAARVLHPLEHRPVVLRPATMIRSPKSHLLAGSPEVRDQDLAGIVVPGRGDDGGKKVRHVKK